MPNKDVSYAVAKAAGNFAFEYRDILNHAKDNHKIDDDTYKLLDDLGCSIKTAFDRIEHQLNK